MMKFLMSLVIVLSGIQLVTPVAQAEENTFVASFHRVRQLTPFAQWYQFPSSKTLALWVKNSKGPEFHFSHSYDYLKYCKIDGVIHVSPKYGDDFDFYVPLNAAGREGFVSTYVTYFDNFNPQLNGKALKAVATIDERFYKAWIRKMQLTARSRFVNCW
jgi:hypothetical protein